MVFIPSLLINPPKGSLEGYRFKIAFLPTSGTLYLQLIAPLLGRSICHGEQL